MEDGATCEKIGIDLGTTNSAVAVMHSGQSKVLTNKEGCRLTPSCVAFAKESDNILVGQPAVEKLESERGRKTHTTVFDAKRLIGKKVEDCEETFKKWQKCIGVDIVSNKGGRPLLEIEHNGVKQYLRPKEISAHVLRKMRETAELFVRGCAQDRDKPITAAVITVPAYFSQDQKSETLDAAHLAGFKVVQLVTEPAAAAYAYGFEKQRYNGYTILVFDFGGGTFDVCVLEVKDGEFKVKMVKGDVNLGGRDVDILLAEHLAMRIKELCGDDAITPFRWQKLVRKCEEAKKTLSSADEAIINLSDPFCLDADIVVKREKFELLCEPLLQRAVDITKEALREAGLEPEQIDEVLLVGGTSRIPQISEMLQFDVGFERKKLNRSVEPDEAIAKGAAILAAQMCPETKDKMPSMALTEAIPLSIGIRTLNDEFSILLPRNSTIPSKFAENRYIGTTVNNQRNMTFEFYEGERKLASKNNFLGKFFICNLPPGIVGSVHVALSLELDRNGILHASAKCGDIVSHFELNYKPPGNGTSVEEKIEEAAIHREVDENEVKRMRAKNELNRAIEHRKYKCTSQSILTICDQFEQWLDNFGRQANTETLRNKLEEFNGKF